MLQYEKKTQQLLNNETLAYIEKGTGKETILLVHGNMASSVHMVTLMDALMDDYRVIAPDLRSFGDSSFNHEFTSLKELAFDLMLFCDALKIDKAHVLGWSTGFGVAMELAILNPSRVQTLFSLEGMSVKGYYSQSKGKDGTIMSHRIYDSFDALKKDAEIMHIHHQIMNQNHAFIKGLWEKVLLTNITLDESLVNLYTQETLKQRSQANINWCWITFNISNEANLYTKGNGSMKEIQCPVSLTKGLKDKIVTPFMVEENIRLLNHPKVFIFEQGDHCLHFDHSDFLVKAIQETIHQDHDM